MGIDVKLGAHNLRFQMGIIIGKQSDIHVKRKKIQAKQKKTKQYTFKIDVYPTHQKVTGRVRITGKQNSGNQWGDRRHYPET
jgi:hypothetical protein